MAKVGVKIFEAIMRPIQRLPLGFHYFWGKVFTWLTKDLLRYRRDEVMINLARSFPDKKYNELKKISNGFYKHLGEIFAESMWFGGCRLNPQKLHKQRICEITNVDEVLHSFNNTPSVMVLTSHFGNWEIIGGLFQYVYSQPKEEIKITSDDVCVVYRRLRNKFWNEFLGHNRTSQFKDFQGYIESMSVLRYAFENKDKHKMYIFPTDQFPYGKAVRYEIPSFMNQTTYAMVGATSLAKKFGMSVYYMSIDRESEEKVKEGKCLYNMTFKKICDDASQMEPGKMMEIYYNYLEEEINRHPENYLWSHKRWK